MGDKNLQEHELNNELILANPSNRSRVIMSDDSENDEKDKMDVDEVNYSVKFQY